MPLLDVLVYFPNNSPTEVGLLGHGSLNLKVFIDTGTLPSIMVIERDLIDSHSNIEYFQIIEF